MVFERELDLLIRSSYPLIYIPTQEEERAEALITEMAVSSTQPRAVYTWDFVEGYNHNGSARANPVQALEEAERARNDSPAVFLLRDFHRFLEDVSVSRKLRNLARSLRATRKTVILLAPSLRVPADLQEDLTILDLKPPTYEEIDGELSRLLEGVPVQLEHGGREALIKACQGLMLIRIRLVIAKAIARFGRLDERSIPLVLEEKKQSIRRTQVLEFWPSTETLEDIGGLDILKSWLEQRASVLTDEARAYGLPNPKGILLVGIQGTGKSLSAKATASQWQLPLLRLDIGRLMGGLVGESEAKTREMIRLAEAMAPCVLFLDELDNEIFFIDLPSERERKEIFQVHLRRVRGDLTRSFDLEALAYQSEGFSGAEIEQAIYGAMHASFDQRREFTTEDIVHALSETVPISRTQSEKIQRIQEWAASGRVRPASSDAARAGVYGQLFGDSA
jgi:hypothetical protein